jgi:hexosaminidase
MWRRNVVNIGLPSTYRFIEKIADELVAMYDDADVKLSAIHVGGDEVPPGVWIKSPACLTLMQEHPELQDVHDLTEYFMRRVNGILESRGMLTAGWEEIALTHKNGEAKPNPLEHHLMPYTWNTLWGEGGEEIPYKLANLGFKVILSNAPNLYFDFTYDKDPEEAGYYWGGYTDTKDTFKFLPMDFFKSAEKDVLGNPIDPSTHYKKAKRLTQKGRKNILGLQGQLWGETIHTAERIEYLLFPRLCALAERAWSKEPDWAAINDLELRKNAYQSDWNEFANRLGQIELPRLDNLFGGVHYRIPLAGANLEDGLLMANTPLPGLTIRYTVDGTEPTETSPVFEQPIQVKSHLVKLKIFSSNGRRSSRTTIVKR